MTKYKDFIVFAIVFVTFFNATLAFAAQTELRIKATVVQCGEPENIVQACMENNICCRFVDQITAARVAEESHEQGAALKAAIDNAETEAAISKAAADGVKIKVASVQDSFFAAQDADENGNVTLEEFTRMGPKATAEIFDRLDRDGNGTLSKPELSKFRAAMKG